MARKATSNSGAVASPAPSSAPASSGTTTPASISAGAAPLASNKKTTVTSPANANRWDQIVLNVLDYYQKNTPQRTKLIDVFMAFLVLVGGLQFLYCVLAGNYVCVGS
jgi:oligosaccharyltransferase complex subunit epsilon